jgi:hypothetical protein
MPNFIIPDHNKVLNALQLSFSHLIFVVRNVIHVNYKLEYHHGSSYADVPQRDR